MKVKETRELWFKITEDINVLLSVNYVLVEEDLAELYVRKDIRQLISVKIHPIKIRSGVVCRSIDKKKVGVYFRILGIDWNNNIGGLIPIYLYNSLVPLSKLYPNYSPKLVSSKEQLENNQGEKQ